MSTPLPKIASLRYIFDNEHDSLTYLLENDVFYNEPICPKCSNPLRVYIKRGMYECRRRSCNASFNIRVHTIFHNRRLPCSKILELAYYWLQKIPVTSVISMTGHSSQTISSLWRDFRDLVSSAVDDEDMVIGGPNIVVEIDESKFGKRKYHRGHRVEGVWVLGGVERTAERRMFAVAVPDRTTETLQQLIQQYVRPGSIIHTDLWRGYNGLELLGYRHETVNHSRAFRDPQTGACTNTIEGTWAGIKVGIPARNGVEREMGSRLMEFIWRRKNANDLWGGFLRALGSIYFS